MGVAGSREGTGVCGRRTLTGDSGAMAGDSCGNPGASGIFNRASSAARDSVRVEAGGWGDKGVTGAAGNREGGGAKGTGSGSNEAGRGDCVWASCCGYTLHMAALKSSQVPGSGKASRVRAKVSHVGPSV